MPLNSYRTVISLLFVSKQMPTSISFPILQQHCNAEVMKEIFMIMNTEWCAFFLSLSIKFCVRLHARCTYAALHISLEETFCSLFLCCHLSLGDYVNTEFRNNFLRNGISTVHFYGFLMITNFFANQCHCSIRNSSVRLC